MANELGGQVAIVTGSGRGIGRAIAQAFAAAGAAVAVTARSQEQVDETVLTIERVGGRALAVPVDVTDRFSVEWLVAETERRLGPVDVLVNNAGVAGPVGPLWENDPDDWRRSVEINLDGTFLCCRAVLPQMVARNRGRIINIASGHGLRATPYLSAYSVSKSGLVRLSEVLAAETREHGVAVFAVGPGQVRTQLLKDIGSTEAGATWLPDFAARAEAHAQLPDRAAALCVRLASGVADTLSGRFLYVRDDLDELLRHADEIRDQERLTLRLRT